MSFDSHTILLGMWSFHSNCVIHQTTEHVGTKESGVSMGNFNVKFETLLRTNSTKSGTQ